MPETTLSFAKIVATPTSTAWSQSYNAGSLFVALSLSGDVSNEEGQTLNALGKEFLNNLEAEFFTLEEKSLSAIKQALTDSQTKIPSSVTLSLAMVFIKQNIVYGYTLGMGKIILRRSGQIGTILTNKEPLATPRDIATSSGILQPKDILLLQTQQFAAAITPEVLKQALELSIPNDIAETLSVPIHGSTEGAAAGVVIMFHGASQTFVVDQKKTLPQSATPTTTPIQNAQPITESSTPFDATPNEPALSSQNAPLIEPDLPTPIASTPDSLVLTDKSAAQSTIDETASTPIASDVADATQNTIATPTPLTTSVPAPETVNEVAVPTVSSPQTQSVLTPETPVASPPTISPQQTSSIETPTVAIQTEAIPVDAPIVLENKKFSLAFLTSLFSKLPFPSFTLTKRHKLAIMLLVIILLALGIGIYFSTRSEKTVVDNELYTKVFPEAQKDYEEGEGLLSLNKNLARDDFLAAQKKLQSLEGKYADGSKEEKAISELKKKVDAQLQGASGIKQATVTELTESKDALLTYAKKNPSTPLTQDDSFLYAVSNKAVIRVDKGNDEDKSIITNDDDWESAKGIGVYLSNVYVLDTKKAVLKFVSSGSSYGSPSSYFPEDATPNTEKAVAMSIDGSIWLLFSDGTVSKYTKGASDNFKISGLDAPLSKPSKIVTNADMTNIYVLDTGNKRIVTIDKKGTYLSQVVSDTLSSATELIIDEKNKKARFLSSGKIYEVGL